MPLPVLAAIGIAEGLKAIGGWFGNRAQKKAGEGETANLNEQARYQNAVDRLRWNNDENRRTSSGGLFGGLARAYGLDKMLPPGALDFKTQTHDFAAAPQYKFAGTGFSPLGSALTSLGKNFEPKFGKDALAGAGRGGAGASQVTADFDGTGAIF